MAETDGELLQRLSYLRGAVWSWASWAPPRAGWDHDHCAVCWMRFTRLSEGYTAMGRVGQPHYHWLCADCFRAHRELFGWSLSA